MDKVPETVSKVLDVMAQKFGATGQYLWVVMVKYQVAMGVTSLAMAVLSGLGMYIVYRIARRVAESKHMAEHGDFDDVAMVYFIAGLICIIPMIAFWINLYDAIPKLLAPEGAALQAVLAAMHG